MAYKKTSIKNFEDDKTIFAKNCGMTRRFASLSWILNDLYQTTIVIIMKVIIKIYCYACQVKHICCEYYFLQQRLHLTL